MSKSDKTLMFGIDCELKNNAGNAAIKYTMKFEAQGDGSVVISFPEGVGSNPILSVPVGELMRVARIIEAYENKPDTKAWSPPSVTPAR